MPVAECVCCWHHGESSWRSGTRAVRTVPAIVVANLSIGVAMLLYQFLGERSDRLLPRLTAAIGLFNSVVIAAAVASYIFVSTRAKRSSQLHLHGLALLLMLAANTGYLAAEVLLDQHTCLSSGVAILLNLGFWVSFKALIFLLMKQKMMAMAPPISCCVQAPLWGYASVVSVMLAIISGMIGYATGWTLLLRGYSCQDVRSVAIMGGKAANVPAAEKFVLAVTLPLSLAGLTSMYVAGFAMMYCAYRLAHHSLSKLRERGVPPEELAKVQGTLGQHVLGVFTSIISTLLVISLSFVADGLDLLGEGTESLVGVLAITIDTAGDVIAVLLLSGIGSLLVREDPAAGDISGHIHSLLHSAVLTSRAETVFEGRVVRTPSNVCVVSFPGKFLAEWNALTWACEQGDLSSACVFLPTSDPGGRFGKHVESPEIPTNTCWCIALYGEEKPWGCAWFQEWKDNVEKAVELGLELVVVFFPGEAGRGTVHWDDLGEVDLWDGIGLGGSQKSEVAYIRKRGFRVIEEGLETFKRRGWGRNSTRKA